MSHNPPSPGHETRVVVNLRHEQDLVTLIRRTRAAAETLRLPERVVRGLAAACFQLGRTLISAHGTRATVQVSGECLEVVYRHPLATHEERAAAAADIRDAVDPLRRMVTDITVDERGKAVTVTLAVDFARHQRDEPARPAPAPAVVDAPADPSGLSSSDATHELGSEPAYRQLQDELRDTIEGVVGLHAELEAQGAQLHQAQDWLRLLLDSAQDYAICTLRAGGEVASWNAGAERVFGYAADEIIGRSFARFYAAGDREVEIPFEQLRRARERGRETHECLQVRQNGTAFEAHVTLTALRAEPTDDVRAFVLVVRDVTERKRLEADLNRRAEDLAAAIRAKEAFLATLSHELRTPLNAMLGWTRLMRLGKLDDTETARALETIERNARIQEQLIADILDVSRIVTGKLRLELKPVDLGPAVQAAADSVRPAAEAKGVYLALDTDVAATVLGDADRLQQVVWNLLVNAIKFTPPEGRVAVTITQDGPIARLTVSDTGEGVSRKLLPVIFNRFTQGDASATRSHGGLGLGLSIVRHIVELHGGRVHAYSEGPGRGATFAVHLPLRAIREVSVPQRPQELPLRGIRVLVVDDDADARDVVALALAQCGAETAAAASAGEALRILAEFKPDVLISDIGMPGEDGYSFIRRVRTLAATGLRDVPAVALTAYSRPEDERRALGAGYQKFVPKPVEVRELAAVVRMLV